MIAVIKRKSFLSSLFLSFILFVGGYNVYKPLPQGLSYEGPFEYVRDVSFLKDITYRDKSGKVRREHEIFDEMFRMIKNARHFILMDMFLFNGFMGKSETEPYRALSSELTDHLIERKERFPDIKIMVITDPINTIYGGMASLQLNRLRKAGIRVVITRLERLRDSNPIYSAFWRIFFSHFGNREKGIIPSPFGKGKVSFRSYLHMINFKANHRKVLITDSRDGYVAMVTSANPHDGSSSHSNVAIQFKGPVVNDLIKSEAAVLHFSGGPVIDFPKRAKANHSGLKMKLITEGKIQKGILEAINNTDKGDSIKMVMFYLSHRKVVRALKEAKKRGVDIRVILDPNKDAFGREKKGIPNRQVAKELVDDQILLKWYNTKGEQCHSKLLYIVYGNKHGSLLLGSANLTRRNLNDFNLETNVWVTGNMREELFTEVDDYFNRLWDNRSGFYYTLPFSAYEENSGLKTFAYYFMEYLGISTF